MTRSTIAAGILALGLILVLSVPAAAQETSPQLSRLVQQLQNDPANQVLRKQIIQLANSLNPKPAVPEKVNELLGEAQAAIKAAKAEGGKADFGDAIQALQKASLLAPWWGDVYYNLGVAEELAGQFNDAISDLRLYLLAEPNAKDAAQVEQRIGEDEFSAKKASEAASAQSSPPAGPSSSQSPALQAQQADADFIRSLNGARYVVRDPEYGGTYREWTIEGERAQLHSHSCNRSGGNCQDSDVTCPINGRVIACGFLGSMPAYSPSECAQFLGAPVCKNSGTVHRGYIEFDWYVDGKRLEPPYQRGRYSYGPFVYDRVR